MGAAQTAGANVAANAKGIDWGALVGNGLQAAKGAIVGPTAPAAFALPYAMASGAANFTKGILDGPAASPNAAPAAAGAVAMPSQAYLATHPAEPLQLQSMHQAAAAADTTPQPTSYDKALSGYAAANGGQMSLRELAVLAHAANETSAYHMQMRNPAANEALATTIKMIDDQHAAATAGLDASTKDGAAAMIKADDDRINKRIATKGVNPANQALGGMMSGGMPASAG
jgi:hypothetical protein